MSTTYATINPFTEQLVKTYTPHTTQQVEQALAKADAAYRSDWSQGPIEQRLAVLSRLAELLVERSDELTQAMALEMGKLANDSHFGLGGSIFAGDIERAKTLASKIETGMVYINTATGTMPELPFGGVKRSGFGRELGDLGIMEFVNKKLVVVAA